MATGFFGELPCLSAGISSDPRNVFMRRVKTKPASGYASKQYIASTGDLGHLGDTWGTPGGHLGDLGMLPVGSATPKWQNK